MVSIMRYARFEDMKSIDDSIKKAMLDDNNGKPPDYFIEDSQGGGVTDPELLGTYNAVEEQVVIDALDKRLIAMGAEIGVEIAKDGELLYD
jgi:hypothetical protein